MQERNLLNNFKNILGRYCAINQFVELSKRCFLVEHEKEIQQRECFVELATKHSVTLTNYDAETMVAEIYRSYIVNVHLCFETFLKDIYNQIKEYGKTDYKPRLQSESYLSCVVRNIYMEELPKDMLALYELCEYYRLVRNTAVHDLCEVNFHKKEFQKLQKYNFRTEAKFKRLQAPNDYYDISFDDFIMFSRSCVELATFLFANLSYDYKKIIMSIPPKQVNKWKKYNKQRLEKVLYAYINTWYKADSSLNYQLPKLAEILLTR